MACLVLTYNTEYAKPVVEVGCPEWDTNSSMISNSKWLWWLDAVWLISSSMSSEEVFFFQMLNIMAIYVYMVFSLFTGVVSWPWSLHITSFFNSGTFTNVFTAVVFILWAKLTTDIKFFTEIDRPVIIQRKCKPRHIITIILEFLLIIVPANENDFEVLPSLL